MKQIYTQQVRVVTSDTAKGFEVELNKALAELKDQEPQLEFNKTMGHCAYVQYTVRQDVPEDIRDEYKLNGVVYHCIECPYFIEPTDGRVKWVDCQSTGKKVGACTEACLYFYQKKARGEI